MAKNVAKEYTLTEKQVKKIIELVNESALLSRAIETKNDEAVKWFLDMGANIEALRPPVNK